MQEELNYNDWVVILATQHLYKAQIAKDVLADNHIKSIIINKQDSAYLFGEIELYALKKDALVASNIIKQIKYN